MASSSMACHPAWVVFFGWGKPQLKAGYWTGWSSGLTARSKSCLPRSGSADNNKVERWKRVWLGLEGHWLWEKPPQAEHEGINGWGTAEGGEESPREKLV